MARKLTLEDLKQHGKTEEDGDELENMYDLIIPPGTPSYIVYDLVGEFNLDPLERKINVNIVGCNERDLIVLRGSLETVRAAEKYLHDELNAYVNSD